MNRTMDAQRDKLPALIRNDFRQTAIETGIAAPSERLMAAMKDVPRHLFVQKAFQDNAYANAPLPIGNGQTISQPYIVALMTEMLQLKPSDRVLEIGTGCGYQSAILSVLCKQVFSLEIIPELAKVAANRLASLGYENVQVRQADGYYGWLEEAPFDAILVAATAEHIPEPLLAQLAPGGRMSIPVREPGDAERLKWITKDAAGQVAVRDTIGVRFVPLTGAH